MGTHDKPPRIATPAGKFVLNARPDTIDFRDRMYAPSLVNVPTQRTLDDYRKAEVEIRDQGTEGACTGFGLAVVADYLLHTRKPRRDSGPVSARMLYAMARRYDEWPGEDYDGSSARGAMKGWFQHGVCSDTLWPSASKDNVLEQKRGADAVKRPLGAYYRVDHSDLVAMHAAIAEVGVLYATARVHTGWSEVGANGQIALRDEIIGGHAFALVGYDAEGFWLQNSWGKDWGDNGFGKISYNDWLRNGTDVWVARLGVPLSLGAASVADAAFKAGRSGTTDELDSHELRPHIISLGNDGMFEHGGRFGNNLNDVKHILQDDFKRITAGWKKPRLMLYAHGGLHGEQSAIERIRHYRSAFLAQEIYPLSIVWHSDLESTLRNILKDSLETRRPQGFFGDAKDFLLDRLDDTLEPLARAIGAKAMWDQMKDNATKASTTASGGLSQIVDLLPQQAELHLVGHSAGSILHAYFAQALATNPNGPRQIESCTLWAPACSMALFQSTYRPLVDTRKINRFSLFTLSDKAEQDDDCAGVYHKSLLYLVSNALEATPHIPLRNPGEPLLGLEKNALELDGFFTPGRAEWVVAPNRQDGMRGSQAKHHGDFDDDEATLEATIGRILDNATLAPAQLAAPLPTRCLKERRVELKQQLKW